ncbi:Ppx/GppA family phosphatase [Micrococcus sp. M4NT]|nr:Ppx/GppA family phosphatase [Micrococcus sp. M4NT]
MTVAGVDCGTNSIRLLISRPAEGADGAAAPLADVVREMRVVRLGEGVDATGAFAEAALERTFAAVDEYARLVQRHHAGRVRFVATSASRDVSNRAAFVAGVAERLGMEPEVVSGEEEARLSFSGAVSAVDVAGLGAEDLILVVDLGGGSTEFVVGTADGAVVDAVSTDMGCVRFTERFLHSDPPSADEVAAARAAVGEILDDVAARLPLERVARVVGVAGTVTTVTAEALGLEEYDAERIHGTHLPVERFRAAAEALLAASRSQRAERGFLHPGRTDVIGAGSLIWAQLLERVAAVSGVAEAWASEHDILDGIVLSLRS